MSKFNENEVDSRRLPNNSVQRFGLIRRTVEVTGRWLVCRAQRAVRLKPLRCTAFVRRHHWRRCLIDVAIIQQSTELEWPSQTNATEGDRIARPDCRRHPQSLQRSSRAQDSIADASISHRRLKRRTFRGHRAVSWYCRAQRAIRLKPLRCTAFVRRHRRRRCLIDVAIIQQSTELIWPSQTNATEADRISRPDCRRHPQGFQRSSRTKIPSPIH